MGVRFPSYWRKSRLAIARAVTMNSGVSHDARARKLSTIKSRTKTETATSAINMTAIRLRRSHFAFDDNSSGIVTTSETSHRSCARQMREAFMAHRHKLRLGLNFKPELRDGDFDDANSLDRDRNNGRADGAATAQGRAQCQRLQSQPGKGATPRRRWRHCRERPCQRGRGRR